MQSSEAINSHPSQPMELETLVFLPIQNTHNCHLTEKSKLAQQNYLSTKWLSATKCEKL